MDSGNASEKLSQRERLKLVKKYLDVGVVEAKDAIALGIDPLKHPDYSTLCVMRMSEI